MRILEILKAMSNEAYKNKIYHSLDYLYEICSKFLETKDLI